jgi:hypothetical protein
MISEQDVYRSAVKYWGLQHQVKVAMEELAELSAALSKYERKPNDINREAMVDEMADALIVIQQMKIAFDVKDREILACKRFKLHRLVWLILNWFTHHPPVDLNVTRPLVDKLNDLDGPLPDKISKCDGDIATGC